jgi:acetyl esterase/lipase
MRRNETYVYKTVGDCAIHADVYRPAAGEKPGPGLVWIHGGALIYGSRKHIRPQHRAAYLEAGYTLIAIDYRLAPETQLPAIIDDLRDAFRWIASHGQDLLGVDPARLGVVGHSAGGYLTLMAGFSVSPPPRVLVSFYGYGDIVADWYSKPDPFYCQMPAVSEEESGLHRIGPPVSEMYPGRGLDRFYLYCRQNGLWPQMVSGHDPATDPAFFEPYCPVRNVSAAYPPTLLLHGTHDTDVPYEQSVLVAQALERAGVEHTLITIPGGPHGFDGDVEEPQVQDAFAAVMATLARHLAPDS